MILTTNPTWQLRIHCVHNHVLIIVRKWNDKLLVKEDQTNEGIKSAFTSHKFMNIQARE